MQDGTADEPSYCSDNYNTTTTTTTAMRVRGNHRNGATFMQFIVAWVLVACCYPTATTTFCSAWTLQLPQVRHRSGLGRERDGWSLHSATIHETPSALENFTTAAAVTSANYSYRQLYPPSNASSNGTIETDSVHTLYYEIHGTGPLKALFLHGGPGAGCYPNHARFFDPSRYTVVLLDQRGAGRSTPKGCVQDNTLEHLVEDCERLRWELWGEEGRQWDCVLGGSWGATLGLAYAQRYPNAMRSLVLRGICALRQAEVDWLFSSEGGSAQNPKLNEAWKNFSSAVSVETPLGGRDALHAYYDCLVGARTWNADDSDTTEDNAIRLTAAQSWMIWEMSATSSSKHHPDNNSSTTRKNMVLVSSPEGDWHFENPLGDKVVLDDTMDSQDYPKAVADQLRRNIHENSEKETPLPTEPRPVRPVDESMPILATQSKGVDDDNSNKTAGGWRLPPGYVPAQAMLTCYYSVNDRYVMGDTNLVLNAGVHPPPSMKIIGVQGGLDPICPPDTAMDLLQAINRHNNGKMELRIPLQSGHSMYDPAIQHELIRATDRLADEFLNGST